MHFFYKIILLVIVLFLHPMGIVMATNPFKPDFTKAPAIKGMELVFDEEFNQRGKPDTSVWVYENGFVRNNELQWYQPENAVCKNGCLIIEARRDSFPNPCYTENSNNWKTNRKTVRYTSSCLKTWGKKSWKFGRFEVRARIDTSVGAWPAIWLLGEKQRWPFCGEIDMLEFYRPRGVASILANVAWGSDTQTSGEWHTTIHPISKFERMDKSWSEKFHVWRMDWDKNVIKLFIDDILLGTTQTTQTINPDGSNPFLEPQYLLLNLALGVNGGDPSRSIFPIIFEVDYVRVYQSV